MGNRLVIVGAGGHGKVIADIARCNGYDSICFLDDDIQKKECAGYEVIGTLKDATSYTDSEFIVGIGNSYIREKVQNRLVSDGLNVVSLIHPSSVIASDVHLGNGTVIMAGVIINPSTKIGAGCIINTGAKLDHDNVIADFVHIAGNSYLAGTVEVGKYTMIGAGATVSNNVSICADCMIGAGAVVVKDIAGSGTYVGVPARKLV